MGINRQDFDEIDRQSNADQIGGIIFGLLWVGGLWFLAIFIWSLAFDAWRLPLLIAGAVVGGFFGLMTGLVIGGQSSKVRSREMKTAASMMLGPPAVLTILAGGIVWLIRSFM